MSSTLSRVADDTYCFASTSFTVTPQARPNPQKWPEIPAVPAESVLDPGLLRTCMATVLERPRVKDHLRMVRAGTWPNTGFPGEQGAVGSFIYREMPKACSSRYTRSSSADIQMLKKGRWVTTQISVAGAEIAAVRPEYGPAVAIRIFPEEPANTTPVTKTTAFTGRASASPAI